MSHLVEKHRKEQPAAPSSHRSPAPVPSSTETAKRSDNVVLGLDALKQTWREYKERKQN